MIVAEVHMKGDRVPAIRSGFRVLAHYIFGSNQAQQKISMTAPVIQQASKIPMSAPVLQQKEKGEWIIRFIMPSTFTLNTLPKAKDSAIKLVEIPSKKYAVIRFSGSNTNENLKEHEDLLDQFLLKNHLKALAQPLYAFYNPPWILPLFRRNEIMIEINN
jgi:hypothetical protein